jgi:3-hydroxyisobutyrate dehydrogenase-like beta-hydroxyacid dehydrogenase
MRIGFIGLGLMGSRMATNLLRRAGYDLVVYNRTRAKAEPVLDLGAIWADSPAQLARQVDLIFTMLAHPEAVKQMALGEEGFLDALPPGAIWADCSTVNPSFSREMASQARERGIRFLDSPVAGTVGPATEGKLLFLVGGGPEDVETCRPLLEVMGRKIVHVGGHGQGTGLKMVFNLLLGEAMLAFSEALVLGRALGLSRDTLLDLLLGSAVVAPFLNGKRQRMVEEEYAAEFPLKWMRKDLHLASLTGYEEGIALPAVNVAKEVFALAAGDGLGDEDFSAIYQFMADKAGLDQSQAKASYGRDE